MQRGRTLAITLEGERRVWLRLARTAFELAGETKPAAALAIQAGKFTEARKLLLVAGETAGRLCGWQGAGRGLPGWLAGVEGGQLLLWLALKT